MALLIAALANIASAQQSTPSISSIQSQIRSHHYAEAIESIHIALSDKPDNPQLWTLEGIAFSLSDNTVDALKAFDKALSLAPNNIAALKGETQLLFSVHDQHAIPLLERIVRIEPADVTAHEMLATLQAQNGNCPAAIGHFLLSASAIGSHPESLAAYGYCLAQTGQSQKAIPIFEQLVALSPDKTYPRYNLAVLLIETKDYNAAIKALEPLLTTNLPDSDVMSLASEAYESTGNTPRAVALLRQAIVASPATPSYYTSFAAICMEHDSFQTGIDMLDAGLQHVSNDPSMYISRGLLYAQIAKYDQAEADFKAAERLDANQSLSSYAIDLAEMQKNQSGKALDEIRSQLKAHPDSYLLYCLLAKLLTSQGSSKDSPQSTEATEVALRAIKLKPDGTEARDILAGIYVSGGNYDKAIEQCRLALQRDPTDQTAIYHLILALRHSSQPAQREEIHTWAKRLSELQQASLKQETARKQFKLVVGQPAVEK